MLRDRVRHALLAPFVVAFDVFLALAVLAWIPFALFWRAHHLAWTDVRRVFRR